MSHLRLYYTFIRVVDRYSFNLLIVSLFFLRLPPLHLLPAFGTFTVSHTIARISLLVICLPLLPKIRDVIYKNKLFSMILIFYFATQSFSIIHAVNIDQFLLMYKTTVFGIIIYFIILSSLDSPKKFEAIIKVLVITTVIDLGYQTIIYFYPNRLNTLIEPLLYGKYWQVLNINSLRGRYFVDIYDSALIPIFLFYTINKAKGEIAQFGYLFVSGSILFFAVLSNFRTQVLMYLFSFASSILLFTKRVRTSFVVAGILFSFLYVSFVISNQFMGLNAIDRILSPTSSDYSTITTRINWWEQSFKMAESNPIFGVGLGNFYDNVQGKHIFRFSFFDWKNQFEQVTLTDPHDIFFETMAETGFLGLMSLLLLLGYFVYIDITLFKRSHFRSYIIISFWSLFIFALFNPPTPLQYVALFWVLRAMIFSEQFLPKSA